MKPIRRIQQFAAMTLLLLAGTASAFTASAGPLTQEKIQCDGVDGEIRFEITIDTLDSEGHTQISSMRVSDPNVSQQASEIAVFDAADGLLGTSAGTIVGYVDEKNPKTSRKGERVGGTTLGQLRSIMLRFDTDIVEVLRSGKKLSAEAVYLKKIGDELVQDLDCAPQK